MTATDRRPLDSPPPLDGDAAVAGLTTKVPGPRYWDADRLQIVHLDAYLEDGRLFEVHADQRDHRRAFQTLGPAAAGELGSDDRAGALTFMRCLAWSYLTRTEQISMGWARFDQVLIQTLDPADGETLTAVDPTGTATAG